MRLAGRKAFVTGAAQGIGRAIAEAFVAEGAKVALADLQHDKAAAVAADLGEGAVAIQCDVSDPTSVEAAIDKAADALGGLTTLVANAATNTPRHSIGDLPVEEWRKAIDINLTGCFLVCRFGIRHLKAEGGGSIILTASQMGRVAYMGSGAYCTAKGGLLQLAKAVALDHVDDGIRCNALSPGGVATDRLSLRFGDLETAEEKWGPMHPMGRLGRSEEIAKGAVFLASDESSFMTGSDLLMDGGYSAW